MAGTIATREDVARLLGRVAFGATPADLAAWTGKPYADLVDHLLNVPDPVRRLPQRDDANRIVLEQKGMTDFSPTRSMQEWWLERMRTAQFPLEERLTLLWHDHFATAVRGPDVPPVLVFRQIQTLRTNALGNFRAMVNAITVDPAMLRWLNGSQSTGRKPNENYAREMLELFTLGTRPQVYTEGDVREAARVLTGWTVDSNGKAAFNATRHDAGTKRVLGTSITNAGATEYARLVDIALAQPVASRFVAFKLVQGLGYEPAGTDLLAHPDPLVARVGDSLRRANFDLKAALRTLLLSDEFRSSTGGDGRRFVRSPTEVVVSTCKALAVPANNDGLVAVSGMMGQQLLVPPSVGGWPKGRRWLSSSTLIARYLWGVTALNLWKQQPPTRPKLPQPADLNGWASFFGLSSFSSPTAAVLQQYLSARKNGGTEELQGGMIDLILTSPDWMVV